MKIVKASVALAAVAGMASAGHTVTAKDVNHFAPAATPIGVTIEFIRRPVVYNIESAKLQRQLPSGQVYADARGRSLYFLDGDTATAGSPCRGPCAASWSPAVPLADARPVAGWSILLREDGSKQWAHAGRPLYTYSEDRSPGDTSGDGVGGNWHLAIFNPGIGVRPPPGIAIVPRVACEDIPTFTDFRGRTLYIFDGDIRVGKSACNVGCVERWQPVNTARLAKSFDAWSVIARDDDTKQWAYEGKPLYTFAGDVQPGDCRGEVNNAWHVALLAQPFIPDGVTVGQTARGATVFTTLQGATLYARDVYRVKFDFEAQRVDPPSSEDGRDIGTAGCSAECPRVWLPLKASAAARSRGYWAVVEREDGTRQWAYKGFPLYAYSGDKSPGDSFGNDIFTLVDGDSALYWRIAVP